MHKTWQWSVAHFQIRGQTDGQTDRQTDRRSYHNTPFPYQKKGKGVPYRLRSVGGVLNAYLPSLGREPVGGYTTEVCDAWPVRRQTYGYLPSRRASPSLDRYQIILLDDRGARVWTTCPRLLAESGTAVIRTRDLLSRKSNALTITPPGHTFLYQRQVKTTTRLEGMPSRIYGRCEVRL